MKAIETEAYGCRFRSRLEARWAVFFTHMGVEWQYEVEGFEFDGEMYLPDFYLTLCKTYIEIKPSYIRDEEDNAEYIRAQILQSLMVSSGLSLWTIYGEPWPEKYVIESDMDEPFRDICFATCRRCDGLCYEVNDGSGWGEIGPHTCGDNEKWPDSDAEKLLSAYKAARQARFEHGESPTFETAIQTFR